jgi:CHAT domain-containing protein
LTLPNGETKFSQYNHKSELIENEILEYRKTLIHHNDNFDYKIAQKIYDWMISPFVNELERQQIETLVFIQDGVLRSVPMAALYDGKQYLIQKYAIATIPSLTLMEPRKINPRGLRVLALGVSANPTVNNKQLGALKNVCNEIPKVTKKIGGKKLLNGDFTRDNLKKELSKQAYPIIHIATHGQFGIKPEDTFIVTGDGIVQNQNKSCEEYAESTTQNTPNPQEKNNTNTITFKELDSLIRQFTRNTQPIELLTLTACETAVGDDRSALGLGGVALQAGARSVLASLWAIDDEKTPEIAIKFYDNLLKEGNNKAKASQTLQKEPKNDKAKALQAVQKKFIDGGGNFSRPYYWSSFVIIGNWL